jgi:hypothetical protein
LYRELIELQEEVKMLEKEQNHFVANVRTSQCTIFIAVQNYYLPSDHIGASAT